MIRNQHQTQCDVHPGNSTEEIFCWETKSFHCPLCAHENGIRGERVCEAVARIIEDSESGYSQMQNSLKKLSERRDRILFEINDEKNPLNLESQMEEALTAIHTTFNGLRESLEQRERALLEEVESCFNASIDQLSNEAEEITGVLERGTAVSELRDSFTAATTAERDAELLRNFVEMRSVSEKAKTLIKKYESSPIIQTSIRVMLECTDTLTEKLKEVGRIVRDTNIPAPQNLKTTKIMSTYVDLAWDPSETTLPITYQVMLKKANDPDGEWTECYNGPEIQYRCSNLQELTNYTFEVIPNYRGMRSANCSTCSVLTVNKKSICTTFFFLSFH